MMYRIGCVLLVLVSEHFTDALRVPKKESLLTNPVTSGTAVPSTDVLMLMRRLELLEESNEMMRRSLDLLQVKHTALDKRLNDVENTLSTYPIGRLVQRLEETSAANREMEIMLTNFEKFFGSLYAESPDAFDPTQGMDTRMTNLNSYLGNREAELLSLRPIPPTMVQDNATITAELLGTALYQIDEESQKLDKKLRNLERKVVDLERGRGKGRRQGNGQSRKTENMSASDLPRQEETQSTYQEEDLSRNKNTSGSKGNVAAGDSTNCNCRRRRETTLDVIEHSESHDELLERLDRLETLTFLNMYPILNASASFDATTRTVDSSLLTNMYTEEQLATIEEELVALRATSSPTNKKTAFSVARTRHQLGETFPQTVEFDHIYVNKGQDFFIENSTFICDVRGYYFIAFNFRSFDGKSLGISLMKNDDEVLTSIFTDADTRNVMESQSIIVHLKKGERLWLRLPPSTRFGFHSDQYKYTTFSGFLIYRGT